MQATTLFIGVVSPFKNTTSKNLIMQRRLIKQRTTVHSSVSAVSSSSDGSVVDYSSTVSCKGAEAGAEKPLDVDVLLHGYLAFSTPAALAATVQVKLFGATVIGTDSLKVFPAEACDTIGGEACNVDMFPEAKTVASAIDANQTTIRQEEVDREYLDYSDSKTVFPGEACDDLGGEFCEPEYQNGVFADK